MTRHHDIKPLRPIARKCETCQFWMRPDLSPEHVGNAGTCTAFEPQSGFVGDTRGNWPFWARGLSRRTLSWEGKGCETWMVRTRGNGYVAIPEVR